MKQFFPGRCFHLVLIILVTLPLLSFQRISPEDSRSWIYLNPQVVDDIAPYDAALARADLDKYRYFDKRNTLHFENGLDVELLSANELIAMGLPVKKDHVRTQEPSFDTKSVFKLTSDGILVEVMTRTKIK